MASTTFPAVGPYGYATTTTGADEGTNYDDIVIIVLGIAVVAVVLVMTYYIANQMRWIENNRPPMPQKQVKPASRPTLPPCACACSAPLKKRKRRTSSKNLSGLGVGGAFHGGNRRAGARRKKQNTPHVARRTRSTGLLETAALPTQNAATSLHKLC